MSIDKSYYLSQFHDSVQSAFQQIENDYGLELTEVNDSTFKLSLGEFDVNICMTWGHLPNINIIISPTAESKLTDSLGIGILNFVEYLEPNFHYIDFRISEPSEIPEKLNTLSFLLRKYCDQFLKRDFSIWPKVSFFVESKILAKSKK